MGPHHWLRIFRNALPSQAAEAEAGAPLRAEAAAPAPAQEATTEKATEEDGCARPPNTVGAEGGDGDAAAEEATHAAEEAGLRPEEGAEVGEPAGAEEALPACPPKTAPVSFTSGFANSLFGNPCYEEDDE
eukprot:7984973-Pyramimonas_sp.AAC.1